MTTTIITGAGTGMGAATALLLAERGHSIVLLGRRTELLEEVAADLPGDDHAVRSTDVADRSSLHGALHGGVLDGRNVVSVFANAGIGGVNEYGADDRWDDIIGVNLTGSYNTAQECLPFLRKSDAPNRNILFTSSCLSRFGVPNYTAYCASKAGINGLTRSLAVELANELIMVNAILPGWVDTEMANDGINQMANEQGIAFDDARAEQLAMVPLGRMSTPQEIAAFVAFLFSEEQRSMTGQCIDINNGSWMG